MSSNKNKTLELEAKIINANNLEDLPKLQEIKSIPRGIRLKVIFTEKTKPKREEIGKYWKHQLPKFSIGIHTNGKEINIIKLITDKEIEENQSLFEGYAREYGILGERLINQFIKEFKVQPHKGFPLKTLNSYGKTEYEQSGKMGEWKYFFHGFHCAFTNNETKQYIEVPLTYGEEYGELDPYFFSKFIKSTLKFHPLPIKIYNDFSDGLRILTVMEKIGKFEKVKSNLKGKEGFILKNRVKKKINVYENGLDEIIKDLVIPEKN